jgi:cell division protein FtsZ
VVINISGGKDMTLEDMTTASEAIYDVVDPDANIIVGAVVDERLEGEIHVTVIATGFESGAAYRLERPAAGFASGSAFNPEPPPPASSSGSNDDRGAKIPPFLLNRHARSEEI